MIKYLKKLKNKKIFLIAILITVYAINCKAAFATSGGDVQEHMEQITQNEPENTLPSEPTDPVTPSDPTQPSDPQTPSGPSEPTAPETQTPPTEPVAPQEPSGDTNTGSPGVPQSPVSSGSNTGTQPDSGGQINTPTTTYVVTNVDTRLQSLSISCGQLVPAFSPDIYEYTVYVTKTQENRSCNTLADGISNNVIISATGPSEFGEENEFKVITVEGQNGEKSEYTINIHVIKDTELYLNNILYTASDDPDLGVLPDGFKKSNQIFRGQDIVVAESPDSRIILLQFINEFAESLWYRLDIDTDNIYSVELIEIKG